MKLEITNWNTIFLIFSLQTPSSPIFKVERYLTVELDTFVFAVLIKTSRGKSHKMEIKN